MNIHAKSWQPMKGHEFYGNWWTSMQISGNQRQLMKIHEHQWKSIIIRKCQCKFMKIDENHKTSMCIYENKRK